MSYTQLNRVTTLGRSNISDQLKTNLTTFFEWGFLEAEGFFNITLDDAAPYGGSREQLRWVDDPRYTDGQVWETFRSNWVWQSGLSITTQPIQISGVWVGGNYYPSNTSGAYAHYVSYPLGRVVFDTAINTTSTVEMEYSYNWVHVVDADRIPWLRQAQFESQRADSLQFSQQSSGDWSVMSDDRVQLPFVAIDAGRRFYTPYELGGSHYCRTDMLFHVVGEDRWSVDQIADAISLQTDKTIYLFDVDAMAATNAFPLDYRGAKSSNPLTYPDLIRESGSGGYQLNLCSFLNATIQEVNPISPSLFYKIVRLETEVVLHNIQ